MTWAELRRERDAAKNIGFQAGWYAAIAYLLGMMPESPDLMDAIRMAGTEAPTADQWAERVVNGSDGHWLEKN